MVDESNGTISWDTPLAHLIPDDFVLSNPEATKQVTVEDALLQRTGYPSHDKAFGFPNATKRDLVRLLRHLPMTQKPGRKYQEQDMMHVAVAHAIEVVTGTKLGDYLSEKLWRPLGMKETFLDPDDARKHVERPSKPSTRWMRFIPSLFRVKSRDQKSDSSPHLATAYRWVCCDSKPAPNETMENSRPSGHFVPDSHSAYNVALDLGGGSTISSVHDCAIFLRSMLRRHRSISPTDYLSPPAASIRLPEFYKFLSPAYPLDTAPTYGLGWIQSRYRNRRIYGSPHSKLGLGGQMTFVPPHRNSGGGRNQSKGWAMAIMMNTNWGSSVVASIIGSHLLHEHLDVPLWERVSKASLFRNAMPLQNQERDLNHTISRLYPGLFDNYTRFTALLPLAAYQGVYHHPGYGNMTVELRSGGPFTDPNRQPYLYVSPSLRATNFAYILYPLYAQSFVGREMYPWPKAEFEAYPDKYKYHDVGPILQGCRAEFTVSEDGMERMGVEMDNEMVDANAESWGILQGRRGGMIWFDKLQPGGDDPSFV